MKSGNKQILEQIIDKVSRYLSSKGTTAGVYDKYEVLEPTFEEGLLSDIKGLRKSEKDEINDDVTSIKAKVANCVTTGFMTIKEADNIQKLLDKLLEE